MLIGMSERSQGRMIEQIAKALFAKEAADRVIACVMTNDRAHIHLDRLHPARPRQSHCRPQARRQHPCDQLAPGTGAGDFHVTVEDSFLGAVADALGVPQLHVVETGGDQYQQEREQWDDGNNVAGLEPGVVVAYERTPTSSQDAPGRSRGGRDRRLRAGKGPGRRALHDPPLLRGPL